MYQLHDDMPELYPAVDNAGLEAIKRARADAAVLGAALKLNDCVSELGVPVPSVADIMHRASDGAQVLEVSSGSVFDD